MFTSFDISICTNHKLAASTHRFFNYFPKRIQIKCFELKNHQTSLVKSWSHITCDGKSQDFFFYPQYLCSVFFSHSFFFLLLCCQSYSTIFNTHLRTNVYVLCSLSLDSVNVQFVHDGKKKERQKCNQIFRHLKWLTGKRTEKKVEIKKRANKIRTTWNSYKLKQ